MKRLRSWLVTLTVCLAASTGLVVATSTPAYAEVLTTYVYGSSHPYNVLGEGLFVPNTAIAVKDTWCDGDNGIIAVADWKNYNEWKRDAVVSVRGCGGANRASIAGIPAEAYVRFTTCKLLPDGAWKDCRTRYTWNS